MKYLLSLCLFTLVTLSAKSAEPKLAKTELDIFQSRFSRMQELYDKTLISYTTRIERSKEAAYTEKLELSLGNLHLAYHRELLMLETDLVTLATPAEALKAGEIPGNVATSERRRVASLRKEIHEAECSRITEALKMKVALHSDERAAKLIYRKQNSLDQLFDRATARQQRDIDKARRNIGREQKSNLTDQDDIAKFEEEIKAAESVVSDLHEFYYGYKTGAGFDVVPGWSADHPAEKLRSTIRSARDEVRKVLRGDDGQSGEGQAKGGSVGGSYIYSANLGVVLDISGSMTAHLAPLKKEIAATFNGPRYSEIVGCRLSARSFILNGDLSKALLIRDTMSGIEELIAIHRIDTLYWFSDLQDARDIQSLRRLQSLLRRGGTAFHVKSVGKSMDRELRPLVDDFQK